MNAKQNKVFAYAIGLIILFCGSILYVNSISARAVTPQKKPNVIILFSDQHNRKVMGFEGHPDVITPNLDKLSETSLVFERAYCATGVCSPSRSSMMSGLYPRTLGLLSNEGHTSVMDDAVSMASLFKFNNYKTYAFGKRHVSGGIDGGWDEEHSHLCNESMGHSYIEWIEKAGYGKVFAMDWAAEFGKGSRCSHYGQEQMPIADLATRISDLPDSLTMAAYTTQLTIEMIKKQKSNDQPFFCWATFYGPHQPYTPTKTYMNKYDVSKWGQGTKKNDGIKKPENLYESAGNLPPVMNSIRNGNSELWNVNKAFADEQLWRNYLGAYYALVTEVDFSIGQIIEALKKADLEEETIIIYTSDHGDFVGNHGMAEKVASGQNVYEDILNVPLIIKIPGKSNGGKRTEELVTLTDILPTLIDLLNLKVPKLKYPFEGKSLAGLIQQNKSIDRNYVVSESWSQATVIAKDAKLGIMLDPTIVHKDWDYRNFGDMFFDRKDSLESHNGIHDSQNFKQIEKLRNYYQEFSLAVSDTGKRERIQKELNK